VKTYFIISNLEIEFNKASLKHNILSPALVGLYRSYLTHKFESEIQEALNEKLKEVGQQITSFLEQNPDTMSLASYVKQMAGFGME
jgi:CRISPR/Cas system-associated protein Cas7 (RAMP superfamily)